MSKTNNLSTFSIKELQTFKQQVLEVKTKEELLALIDSTLQQKTYILTQSMNAHFPIDWFNIDQEYIELLHSNGINNLAQLRNIQEADLWQLRGMTQAGYSQISWARDFFDMTSTEKIKASQHNNLALAKVIVKHANGCSKKHKTV